VYNDCILKIQKGVWVYILSKKIKYYTKEMIKLTNIIAIGILIIIAIILTKFKMVYTVYLNEQEIGCVQNKSEFEKNIEKQLYNNQEENIAFSDINAQIGFKSKFIAKNIDTQEEQVLLAIKEKSDITYYQYAVNVAGVERTCLKEERQAREVADTVREELSEETNVSVQKIYTKELNIAETKEIAEISSQIVSEVKEQKKIEEATISGIYLAVNPVQGRISSRYGAREAVRNHTHQGLDIAATTGTPIKAVADGTVSYSGIMGGYGYLIIIDHGNGIKTYYGHCSKLYVKVGKKVKAGDVIAAVGSTGNSTGPHLHFEIRQNGKYVNPQKYLYK